MDYGTMLDEAFFYAKGSIWNRANRWFVLIICMIIFPLILGYIVRIYRGVNPAPEPDQWGPMFIDGLKLLLVEIVYTAPVILLVLLACMPVVYILYTSGLLTTNFNAMTGMQAGHWLMSHSEFFTSLGIMAILLLLAVLLGILLTLFSFLGTIRFARTGSIPEAFCFSAILSHIRRIGWLNYILALVVISVIGFIFSTLLNVFSFIPVIGDLIGFVVMIVLYVPFIVFTSRYAVLVYDAGEEMTDPVSGTHSLK